MRFILLTFLLALSGCAYDLVESDSGRVYVREFIEPEKEFLGSVPIRLVPGEETRLHRGSSRTVFSVERIWARIFSTDEHIKETLKVTSARFARNTAWTRDTNTSYVVKAELRCDSKVFPISAKGSRDTRAYEYVKQEIVQQAVRIVADRAVEHLEQCKDAAPKTDEE